LNLPSGSWKGFERVPIDAIESVEKAIAAINFDALKTRAMECRRHVTETTGDLSNISCSINSSKFANGRVNLVFEIEFSDRIILIARVRTDDVGIWKLSDNELKSSMETEVQTIQYIADHSDILVPTVLDFSIEKDNPVGTQYMIMTALSGQPLGRLWPEIPEERQHLFFEQFARHIVQLSQLTFPAIGNVRYDGDVATVVEDVNGDAPYYSSVHYVHETRTRLNLAVVQDKTPGNEATVQDRQIAGWIMLQATLGTLLPDYSSGPFPIDHPDLHYNNILVDDQFNITGIIDWTGVSTSPQEIFATIHGFNAPFACQSGSEKYEQYRKSRDNFRRALKKAEDEIKSSGTKLAVSTWVGGNESLCLELGMDGFPRRCVAMSQTLVERVGIFGEGVTWADVRKRFHGSLLFKGVLSIQGHSDK